MEHIIKPINLTRPSLLIPDVQLPQISQRLDRALEPLWTFRPPEAAHEQHRDVSTLQLSPQPPCLASAAPAGYAPQIVEQKVHVAPSSKMLPLTYGVCVKGTDHVDKKNLQPKQMLKEVSLDSSGGGKLITEVLGENCSHWNYKEQRPNLASWSSSDTKESGFLQGSPGQMQQLLLRTDGVEGEVYVPQLAPPVLGHGGCYRKQTERPLLLSAVLADTERVAEEESPLPPPAGLLLSVRTGNSLPGENSTEHWVLPDSFSHSAKLLFPETQETETLTAAKRLSCTKLSNVVSQDAVSERDMGTPLTMLFKDLDLKVLWDQEENTEFY